MKEQSKDQERLAVLDNCFNAFNPQVTNTKIRMLEEAKNWDHWFNVILGMCEMSDKYISPKYLMTLVEFWKTR